MEHSIGVYGLQVRVPYVLSSMVNATLATDRYHLTTTPFKEYNLVDTHAQKVYTHNIEIATQWLSTGYLVTT